MTLSVCFLSAELAPWAKAGGLGDVVAALSVELARRDVETSVVMPRHRNPELERLAAGSRRVLDSADLQLGRHAFRYHVLSCPGPLGVRLFLVDCPELFDREGVYGGGGDEHLRWLLLCHAALALWRTIGRGPDVLHCNDWHTAAAALLLRADQGHPALAHTRSLLTIHNLGYQGVISAGLATELGLGDEALERLDAGDLRAGRINLLKEGIRAAHAVNTVSPTYAREICTPELGMGLHEDLSTRPGGVIGILNGIDTRTWDPAADPLLPVHYSARTPAGKHTMRTLLCEKLGLTPGPAPVVGMVSRLVWQKGIDLALPALEQALAEGSIAVAVLGSGELELESALSGLGQRFPGRLAFRQGHDEALAHWIEAGSDAFLMPSRYEPCGLNQMYSLRYGTVPLVRATGGLADSVQDFDESRETGTGIVFRDADSNAVAWALGRMVELFQTPARWNRLRANGMAVELGWERPAGQYVDLYQRLVRQPVP